MLLLSPWAEQGVVPGRLPVPVLGSVHSVARTRVHSKHSEGPKGPVFVWIAPTLSCVTSPQLGNNTTGIFKAQGSQLPPFARAPSPHLCGFWEILNTREGMRAKSTERPSE